MDRYYKIAKDSETGKKLSELVERYNDFEVKKREFAEKYGIKGFYSYEMYLAHVGDVVFKDSSHVDKNNWKKGCASNAYLPKQNPKDRQLKKDWEELRSKSIQRFELDKIVGGKDPFHMCGFDYSSEDFFFIFTEKPEKFDFPSDVIEISNLEYLELIKQK